MSVMGRPSWQSWVEEYAQSHRHPVNRLCHTLGIPIIVLSLAMLPLTALVPGLWRASLALFVLGWVFQFTGHAVEKTRPEFMKDWRFLLVGMRWWVAKLQGKA